MRLNAINPPKCSKFDYINFLIAFSRVFSCTEAFESIFNPNSLSRGSFTRLLIRQPLDMETSWGRYKTLLLQK